MVNVTLLTGRILTSLPRHVKRAFESDKWHDKTCYATQTPLSRSKVPSLWKETANDVDLVLEGGFIPW